MITSNHLFDAAAGCDVRTFQPCSDRALANHKSVVDSFRSIYGINSGKPWYAAVAVGRYSEDIYYNGNPWYLTTLAAAEQLYNALYVWKQQGSITVTSVSLAFFRDRVPNINTGTYNSGSGTYTSIINAVQGYADGFMDVVATYAYPDGRMPEQFTRDHGTPTAAADLTWSYSAFLSAAARREGSVPAPWVGTLGNTLPGTCVGHAIAGSYTSATRTSFPASQTPKPGSPTSVPAPAPTCNDVLVTFTIRASTAWGETVKLVGNLPMLGAWAPANGLLLSSDRYTASNPIYVLTALLPAGQTIQYKYIRVASNGAVTWESDPNRSFTVPSNCAQTASFTDTWK